MTDPRLCRNGTVPHGLASRFWSKVDQRGTDECWLWTAYVDRSGYGRVHLGTRGQNVLAHRAAWLLSFGDFPPQDLDHLCHTRDLTCSGGTACLHRRCVNPRHLEPVTNVENARRGRAGQRTGAMHRAKTHCPAGHPYDETNTFYRKDSNNRVCRACNRERARERQRRIKEGAKS